MEEDDEDDETYAVQILYAAVAKYIPLEARLSPPTSNRVHFYIYPEDIIDCSTPEDNAYEDIAESIWDLKDGTLMYPLLDRDRHILQEGPADDGDSDPRGNAAETWGIHRKAVGYEAIDFTSMGFQLVDWDTEVTLFGEADED